MTHKPLGTTGLQILPLVLGGNVFGWTADETTSHAILDAFVAGGGNCIDTADVYSCWVPGHRGGESETVLGNWLQTRGRRDDVIIATKVGMELDATHKGLEAGYILRAVEDSLRRLRTDYIDIYYSHRDDAALGVEEPLRAYEQLIRDGKVRVIGASNFSSSRLSEALGRSASLGLPAYEVLQPHYNLLERENFETELLPVCVTGGLGVLCYFALASGFLTGKYRSAADLGKSPRGQGAGKYLHERGLRVLAQLDVISAETAASPAQVALAWVAAKPGVTAPIASATTVAQVEELLASTRIRLSRGQVAALDAVSA
ncbi:MAG: aldo/keto reductase [Pseudomonadota bacterium]